MAGESAGVCVLTSVHACHLGVDGDDPGPTWVGYGAYNAPAAQVVETLFTCEDESRTILTRSRPGGVAVVIADGHWDDVSGLSGRNDPSGLPDGNAGGGGGWDGGGVGGSDAATATGDCDGNGGGGSSDGGDTDAVGGSSARKGRSKAKGHKPRGSGAKGRGKAKGHKK